MNTGSVHSTRPASSFPVPLADVHVEEFRTDHSEKRFGRHLSQCVGVVRVISGNATIRWERSNLSSEFRLSGLAVVSLPPDASVLCTLGANATAAFVRIPAQPFLAQSDCVPWPSADNNCSPAIIRTRDHALVRFCDSLIDEYRNPGLATGQVIDSLGRLIAVECFRQLSNDAPTRQWAPLTPRQLKLVEEHVEKHLHREVPLTELAALLRYSPHYFCRVFKRATGVSPHQFVLNRRIERAKNLLRESKVQLSELALEVGFANQSHFGATFRRAVGMTPHRYRMTLR